MSSDNYSTDTYFTKLLEKELFSFDRILFKSNIFTVVRGHILHILMHHGEQ